MVEPIELTHSVNSTKRRETQNLRVDGEKMAYVEEKRKAGFGMASTERNRSDVYNELLGYGIQVDMLRSELGEREFEKLWRIIHRINWSKLNLDKVEKIVAGAK